MCENERTVINVLGRKWMFCVMLVVAESTLQRKHYVMLKYYIFLHKCILKCSMSKFTCMTHQQETPVGI